MIHEDTLYVAVGGGGDALAAIVVAQTLGWQIGEPGAHIASFAWERKRFDPAVGPRSPQDFRGLKRTTRGVWRVTKDSSLRGAGSSFLPAISELVDQPIHLLDPRGGARQIAAQLGALTAALGVERTVLVDAGGDILAIGSEPGLRSPLADALALAAAAHLDHDVWVSVVGLGLDGELTQGEYTAACRWSARENGRPVRKRRVKESVAAVMRDVLEWHPSEVTGLLCLAALGYTGRVELRGEGLHVQLNAAAADVHLFHGDRVLRRNAIAQALLHTISLGEAEAVVRDRLGRSELDEERRTLARLAQTPERPLGTRRLKRLEAFLLRYSEGAARDGVSFLTLRRVAEVLDVTASAFPTVSSWLRHRHPARFEPPVWRTRDPVERDELVGVGDAP